MGTPVMTNGIGAFLAPDLRQVYFETGKDRPLEYEMVFNIHEMEWNPITDRQVSGLGTMPGKDQGGRFTLDDAIIGGTKTYTAEAYGMALEFTFEAWRDELYGVLKELVRCMRRASLNRQEVDAWDLLNRAFNTAEVGFTASEALCSTSHARLDGGTAIANRPSPDVGFSVTGIQGGITRFENMVDERGLPRLMAPNMFVIAPENKFVAREILGSANAPYTADNEINALVEEDMTYMVSHYLTTTTYWFSLTSKGTHDLNFMWRDHPIFDSYDDPATKNAVFTAYQRHTRGYGSHRGIDGSTG
jgi:hypothetical protein